MTRASRERAAILDEVRALRDQLQRAVDRARVLQSETRGGGGDLVAYTYLDAAIAYAVVDAQRLITHVEGQEAE